MTWATSRRGDFRKLPALRRSIFALLLAIAFVASWPSLVGLFQAALQYDQCSHILLVIPVSVLLLGLQRHRIFRRVDYYSPAAAALPVFAAAFLYLLHSPLALDQADSLSLAMFLLVGWSVSAFLLCFGTCSLRAACFPLGFLLMAIPLPGVMLAGTTSALQRGSADATYIMLKAANVPVMQQGVILSLPGIDIEVAEECSGIRSSLMLLVVSLVLGHLFLRQPWRKALLSLAVVPITILKNGLRIFALSTLATYVDPSILNGKLHHYGGIPFFILALASLMMLLYILEKSERMKEKRITREPKVAPQTA